MGMQYDGQALRIDIYQYSCHNWAFAIKIHTEKCKNYHSAVSAYQAAIDFLKQEIADAEGIIKTNLPDAPESTETPS